MIVVLGRPALAAGADAGATGLGGLAAGIALEAAARGARVELVGSIGDDADGDQVVVELGRARVGHAALLRDPSAETPRVVPSTGDHGATTAPRATEGRRLPRLDAGDVELGLRYVTDVRVVIIAEHLEPTAVAAAADAAGYHGAHVVAVTAPGESPDPSLGGDATVLEQPVAEGDEPSDVSAFAALIAALAVGVDSGKAVGAAFKEAAQASGWEHTPGD